MARRGKYVYDDLGTLKYKDVKIDGNFLNTLNHIIYVTSKLKNELDDMWTVKDNPDMHTNRYFHEKNISDNNKNVLNDVNLRKLSTKDTGQKITLDKINSIIQYYNSISSNGRGVLPNNLYPSIPEFSYGDKLSYSFIDKIIANYNGLNSWLNQNWSKSFNSDGYCIKSCQIGCQVGCEIAAQLPDSNGEGHWYPPNVGIRGYQHAYPGRYYSSEPSTSDHNSDLWWSIVLVNCGKPWEEYAKIDKSPFIRSSTPFGRIYAVTNNTIRARVRAYNKEREAYNRAQKASGRNPYGYLPYFSIELYTYVVPLNDYWLNSDHIDNNEMHGNGSHNYYNRLFEYAKYNRDGFVFVDYDNDWVVFGNSKGYENKTVDYYRYVKCNKKNNRVYTRTRGEFESGCEVH